MMMMMMWVYDVIVVCIAFVRALGLKFLIGTALQKFPLFLSLLDMDSHKGGTGCRMTSCRATIDNHR